jgi:DNA-binding transcriptional ArsR family regulator
MLSDLKPQLDFVPAEEMVIADLKTLKVLSDPLRLRIRELMTDPTTVKQVAAVLNIPATKLYYHIDQLEKHGLIVLVDTRIVSGIIEKHYQISARQVRVARQLLSPEAQDADKGGLSLTLKGLFQDTQEDLIASIHEGTVSLDDDANHHGAIISSTRFMLDETQAGEFYDRLRALFNEYVKLSRANQEAKGKDGHYYKALLAVFPSSRQQRTGDTSEQEVTRHDLLSDD